MTWNVVSLVRSWETLAEFHGCKGNLSILHKVGQEEGGLSLGKLGECASQGSVRSGANGMNTRGI